MGADFVAIVTDKMGEIGVWRITLGADGAPRGERIVSYSLGSITEGCVIDDDLGVYYLGDELRGIWRASLDDPTGVGKRQIDTVGGGNLVADVEGLTLWRGPDQSGYLIASVQGRSRYAVYDRQSNAFLGVFAIGASADGSADAVSGTDGIDVVSSPLGAEYPQGLFVAQDDENAKPSALQNFKYVSWADVAAALSLNAPPAP
jgi:3-phytase